MSCGVSFFDSRAPGGGDSMLYLHKANALFGSLPLFLLVISRLVGSAAPADAATNEAQMKQFLSMGIRMLSMGQPSDALSNFHSAVALAGPTDFLPFYHRATALLAVGRAEQSISDLDTVLERRPTFNSARLQRANALLRIGKPDEALADFENVARSDESPEGAQEAAQLAEKTRELSALLARAFQLTEPDTLKSLPRDSEELSNLLSLLNRLVEEMPQYLELRYRRADALLASGGEHARRGVSDLIAASKLQPDNVEVLLRIAKLLYDIGDSADALEQTRECLRRDQDHKECHKLYKKLKKVAKIAAEMQAANENKDQKAAECVDKGKELLEAEPSVGSIRHQAKEALCGCYAKEQSLAANLADAMKFCTEVIEENPNNAEAFINRGELHLATGEEWEEATSDFRAALKIDEGNRRATEGLNRAEKMKKRAGRRDYYKILGVRRNANTREITKAYRKMAMEWHPDKFAKADDAQKKHAEKMFVDIAGAKEVLTDPEMRKRFDAGEDPLSAEEQANQGGGHYGQPFFFRDGFNPFGQGAGGGGGGNGYTFQFHF